MDKLKKIFIIILFIAMFLIVARLDNVDPTTPKADIEQSKQQRIININSRH